MGTRTVLLGLMFLVSLDAQTVTGTVVGTVTDPAVFAVPGALSLGAWEMKARWSYLDLDPLNKGQYNDFTFGFNWYWTDRTRVMFDWINPYTSRSTPFGATQSNIIAMRFDFNW